MKKSLTLFLLITVLLLASCATPTPVAPTATAEPSATATILPTIPPTFTPTTLPMLTVNQTVDCRTGPGPEYDLVVTLKSGQQVEPVARDSSQAYWIVKDAEGKECWVDAQSVSLSIGQVDLLPEFTPPPSPTPAPPAAPSEVTASYTCEPSQRSYGRHNARGTSRHGTDLTIKLTWKDNANNEIGYQVFNGSEMVATLPANSTSYSETITFPNVSVNTGYTYGVLVYNDVGKSTLIKIEVPVSCR